MKCESRSDGSDNAGGPTQCRYRSTPQKPFTAAAHPSLVAACTFPICCYGSTRGSPTRDSFSRSDSFTVATRVAYGTSLSALPPSTEATARRVVCSGNYTSS